MAQRVTAVLIVPKQCSPAPHSPIHAKPPRSCLHPTSAHPGTGRPGKKKKKDLELRLLLEGFIFIFRCLGFCCKMNELQRNLNLYVCKINFSFLG